MKFTVRYDTMQYNMKLWFQLYCTVLRWLQKMKHRIQYGSLIFNAWAAPWTFIPPIRWWWCQQLDIEWSSLLQHIYSRSGRSAESNLLLYLNSHPIYGMPMFIWYSNWPSTFAKDAAFEVLSRIGTAGRTSKIRIEIFFEFPFIIIFDTSDRE